ncbi:hypothetical protein J1614_000501 [Plenodomus biglobosus]|nr:hypothetical protein J1614_000501 [Plenodomus biglobosus]
MSQAMLLSWSSPAFCGWCRLAAVQQGRCVLAVAIKTRASARPGLCPRGCSALMRIMMRNAMEPLAASNARRASDPPTAPRLAYAGINPVYRQAKAPLAS